MAGCQPEKQIHEGESFKQAVYNGKMTDSENCIIDKIELILKHYPDSQDISLSTYQSDETSDNAFYTQGKPERSIVI